MATEASEPKATRDSTDRFEDDDERAEDPEGDETDREVERQRRQRLGSKRRLVPARGARWAVCASPHVNHEALAVAARERGSGR